MKNLNSVRLLVRIYGEVIIKDFMVKLDLKGAYFVVPVKKSHCRYFRFSWRGGFTNFSAWRLVWHPFSAFSLS